MDPTPWNEPPDRLLVLVDRERSRTRLEGLYKWGGPGRELVDPVMLLNLRLFLRNTSRAMPRAGWTVGHEPTALGGDERRVLDPLADFTIKNRRI